MSLQACAEIVRRGDPDRFLAAMAAPTAARAILFPLYAFNVEVARAPWVTSEPMIAEIRLQWWRDALDEIAGGGRVRAHEVTTPLADVLDAEGAALLDRLVQARRWDVYRDPFEDAAHFTEYLDHTCGNLTWAAARALGVMDGESDIRNVAWASGLANWFLAVPELAARGRRPLLDDGAQALRTLAGQGLDRLRCTRPPRTARVVLLSTWRAATLLRKVNAGPERVVSGGLRQADISRRFSLLWRSALR